MRRVRLCVIVFKLVAMLHTGRENRGLLQTDDRLLRAAHTYRDAHQKPELPDLFTLGALREDDVVSDDADSDADSDPGPDTASGMAPGSGAPGGPAEAVGQGEHYDDGHFEHEDPGPASAPVAGEFNLKPE